MKRFAGFLTTIALAAWLLPLGAFIKPSQEKTACDGRRAMHMCTMQAKVVQRVPAPERVSLVSGSGAESAHPSAPGGGGQEFLHARTADDVRVFRANFERTGVSAPLSAVLLVPCPVPKR